MSKIENFRKKNFCKFCNKIIIGNSYQFKSHLFHHNAIEARYKCAYCSKEYFRFDTYARHLRSHDPVAAERHKKIYVCDYCNRKYINKYNIMAHLKKVHNDSLKFDPRRFTCNICDVSYCEQRILDRHIRKIHFNVKEAKEPTHLNKLNNESWIEKVENKNICVQMTKLNNNVIIIQKCVKLEDVKVDNIKVKNVNYAPEFEDQFAKAICDYCKKEMIKKSLRTHIRELHSNRRYNCSKCNKKFKRRYQVADHKCDQGNLNIVNVM